MHGGNNVLGTASGTFKNGRYSKHLPTRLAARYHEAQADPALLALREEIALADARLADLLARVDTGESGALWRQLREAAAKTPADLAAMADLIVRGAADYAAWDEVGRVLDQRRRLVESERKRLVEAQQMLSAEQAMVLLAVVTDTIRRHIHDRDVLAAISADIGRLVALPAGQRPDGPGGHADANGAPAP